ncbi:hypothetical protein HMPREF1624_04845 [Sporothrix schenckii ATCC 58251]|uniref:Alpha/beta hydrolase fold-3 domain-containing protein n=1 Tax=Sporothrix schenckii (strain ATCC 58251 / de Perez 2211183) TaxID=1391915 RepID=U7PR47_SPOS1|nr:hypothetical protein HMPREF1624_04845 [Sporothrix schenckii ATCC 58251]
MVVNTLSVSMAVTPAIVATFFSHYLNRTPRRQRPTAHLPYDQGLNLVRTFLIYASHHTVEEVQAFMAQWVPAPTWIRLEIVTISDEHLAQAATVLQTQLGPDGLRLVGGKKWWQWRKPKSPLQAEWIEMKSNYTERKKNDGGKPARRVMFYIHGGAYYLGSVHEHRYQLQRHARKLKARVFAPRYRLAPQFPFPCGLHDCLGAYLHLLSLQGNDANTIVLAGDSAGGGMVLSLLVVLRDRGIALPAGAILISPWVDLTHSFPSLTVDAPFDYIPPYGFHQRPSKSWPPPSANVLEEVDKMNQRARAEVHATKGKNSTGSGVSACPSPPLTEAEEAAENEAKLNMFAANNLKLVANDGTEEILVNEQIHMYTTNNMLSHPLVSPALQPTLGGLRPLLIISGGGEILRDEQMYVAHKCADPAKYAGPEASLDEEAKAQIARYPPTDVQLQVWDDLCHVATTLSFTRPAKFMFRSIAQFGAWVLARAQKTEIDILDDDAISVISASSSDLDAPPDGASPSPAHTDTTASGGAAHAPAAYDHAQASTKTEENAGAGPCQHIGKAGDSLPPFKHHMIRQRVTRHGDVYPLAPPEELPGTKMALENPAYVGVPKEGPVRRWTATKQQWDSRYSRDRSKVLKKRLRDAAVGFESFGPGEHPPPSALAGWVKIGEDLTEHGPRKQSHGLALWSLWGSKHDESTVEREQDAHEHDAQGAPKEGAADPAAADKSLRGRDQSAAPEEKEAATRADDRSRSRRRYVRNENQADGQDEPIPAPTPIAVLLPEESTLANGDSMTDSMLNGMPSDATATEKPGRGKPLTPYDAARAAGDANHVGSTGKRPFLGGIALPFSLNKDAETASMVTLQSTAGVPGLQETSAKPSPAAPMTPAH